MYISFRRCILSSCVVAVFIITLLSPTDSASLTHRRIGPTARPLSELFKEDKRFCHANVFCQSSTPFISEAILSSSKWNPFDSVSLIFRTASLPIDQRSLIVNLYRIEPRPLMHPVELPAAILRIPKHVHVGTIIRNYIISQYTEYTLTFTPPSFLRSGKYLLVMSQDRYDLTWFGRDIEHTIQISAEASLAFDRMPNLILSSPMVPTGPSASQLDVDTLPLVISNIDNLIDLCSLCSVSKSQQRICDTTFDSVQYPSDLVFTEYYDHIAPSVLQSADPSHGRLTTTSICRLAHIDNMIQKLEFKYNRIPQKIPIKPSSYDIFKPHVQSKLNSPTPSESAKASNTPKSPSLYLQSSHLALYNVWYQPNIYYHFLAHLIHRYNSIIDIIADQFRKIPFKIEKVGPIEKVHVHRRECEDYLENRASYLVNLPKTTEFKVKATMSVVSRIAMESVETAGVGIVFIEDIVLRYKATGLFQTIDDVFMRTARNRVRTIMWIWEW